MVARPTASRTQECLFSTSLADQMSRSFVDMPSQALPRQPRPRGHIHLDSALESLVQGTRSTERGRQRDESHLLQGRRRRAPAPRNLPHQRPRPTCHPCLRSIRRRSRSRSRTPPQETRPLCCAGIRLARAMFLSRLACRSPGRVRTLTDQASCTLDRLAPDKPRFSARSLPSPQQAVSYSTPIEGR